MKSLCASFALVLTAWASASTVAAQSPAPASSQTAPQVTAPTPVRPAGQSQAPGPGINSVLPGPIIATGTNAAYVSAQSTGNPTVFIGSDFNAYGIVGTFSNHPLGFRTNNTARMYIDTTGNVGIGTTGPGYKLDVSGDANITGTYRVNGIPISATSNWTQAGNAVYYTGGNVGIGTTSPAYPLDVAGRMRVRQSAGGTAGVWFYPTPAGDTAFVGLAGDTQVGFWGNTGAGWGFLMDTTSGNVSIGGTYSWAKLAVEGPEVGALGVTSGSQSKGVAGIAHTGVDSYGVYGESFNGSGVVGMSINGKAGYFKGNVEATGNICAANVICASDARLKENVRDLDYGLPDLMRLRPVSWSWSDQTQRQLPIGLIAQDVEGVIPELVLRDADPAKPLGLNYLGLVPVMIKAIQDQQDIIAALKAENATLDARLGTLEQALEQSRGQP